MESKRGVPVVHQTEALLLFIFFKRPPPPSPPPPPPKRQTIPSQMKEALQRTQKLKVYEIRWTGSYLGRGCNVRRCQNPGIARIGLTPRPAPQSWHTGEFGDKKCVNATRNSFLRKFSLRGHP